MFIKRKIKNIKKNVFRLKLLVVMFLIVGSIINGIVITLYNVDKSVNLDEVSRQMNETKNNLSSLNEDISISDSLMNFLGKSEESGFSENSRVIYFSEADSIAQAR